MGYGRDFNRLKLAINLAVLLMVGIWIVPTVGLLVTSFRDPVQISATGWWSAFSSDTTVQVTRLAKGRNQVQTATGYQVTGNLFDGQRASTILSFGLKQNALDAYQPGQQAATGKGHTVTVNADGSYIWQSTGSLARARPPRVFFTAVVQPSFGTENYAGVLYEKDLTNGEYKLDTNGDRQWSRTIAWAFVNSLTVAIPATIIPILMAAFCAYALAWMRFPGRMLFIAIIVGLLVVPLQLSLIPVLRMHKEFFADFLGMDAKGFVQVWLAHTGFGLPLAIYLLRNYMASLPREIIDSAKVDGATDFQVFVSIVLPLSFPALAGFAIFQFLWTWNDFLVASIFLGSTDDQQVLTQALKGLLGSRGGNWEILSASAFVSIAVPLLVFFCMQRYLVRGLLTGSVK